MDDAVWTTGPSRWGGRSTLLPILITWSLGQLLVSILVYEFVSRLWGSAGMFLSFMLILFAGYYNHPSTRGAEQSTVGQHQVDAGVVGLSQRDIEAIPAFEYRAADADADGGGSGPSSSSSVEECAVCISVLQDGETVRRLPACGHAFHARCINGWLLGHATCPICRAAIKVVAGYDQL